MTSRLRRLLPALSRDQWLMFLGVFLAGFGDALWLHLQPLYIKFLGARPEQIGAALGLAGVAVIFLYIPSGLLSDRGHYKRIILAAWLISTVAVAWLALAPDWRWAIPGFALFFLSSFARPALSGYVAATDLSGNLGRTFAVVFSGYWIGSILSPALGGWIAEHVSLRAVFWCAAGFYVVSTLVLAQLNDHPAPVRVGAFRPQRLLSDRVFLWHIFVFLLLFFALDVGVVLAPNYLQDVKGLHLEQIGQLGTVASVGSILLTFWLGRMRTERRTSLLLAQLAIVLALLLMLSTPAQAAGRPAYLALILAYFLRGGANAIWTITSSRLSHWLEPEVLSLGFGFRDTVTRIALILSPLLAGQLYARGPALPLHSGLLVLGMTMLLTLTLPRGSRRAVAEAPEKLGLA